MSKLPFFLFSSLLASTSALAFDADQRCTAQPSCESMGYSKSAKTGCSQIIKCPFDLSYTLCLDCSQNNTCPEDSTRSTLGECFAAGGLPLSESYQSDSSVCCKLCPEGYRKILSETTAQADFLTCDSKVYSLITGGSYQCCTGECPKGMMPKEECSAKNGIVTETIADCVKCATCENGVHLKGMPYVTGEKPYPDSNYQCTYMTTNHDPHTADVCCTPYTCTCPDGTLANDSADITEPGTYCLSQQVDIMKYLPGTYTFKHARQVFATGEIGTGCQGRLHFGTSGGGATIYAEVPTTFSYGAGQIGHLKISRGLVLEQPTGGTISVEFGDGMTYISSQKGTDNSHLSCTGNRSDISHFQFETSDTSANATGIILESSCNGVPCEYNKEENSEIKKYLGNIKDGYCQNAKQVNTKNN